MADNGAMTKLEKRGRYQYGGGQIHKKYRAMTNFPVGSGFLLENLKD
jgi:hypothetical protein